ncbi:MAG: DNA internalization-related competence protein ComEC/Rec2 [Defluviitaleaceae bacterium]|nr:DNA internalization-related competence protein ComEC/Rec2 [Defluviitaleaceae bacterium]
MFAFLACGIVFSRYAYPDIGLFWLALAGFAVSFGLWVIFKQKIVLFFPILTIIGFFLLQNSIVDKYQPLYHIAENSEIVTFSGIVRDVSGTAGGRTTIIIQTDLFSIGEEDLPAKVNILAYLGIGDHAEPGAYVTVTGRLQALRFQRNPGAYDEFTYLRTRKIQYTIFPDIYVIEHTNFYLRNVPGKVSSRLQAVLHRVLPPNEAGVLTAILLGDRTGLSQETRDIYREAGVYHILAVSGLHISIAAAFIMKLLSRLKLNNRTAGAITLAFLLFYCIMTGAAPGTVRAVVMSGTYIIGALIYRRSDGLSSLSFAAVALLLYEPLYLWDVGFQFSFTAVAGLMLGTPALLRFFGQLSAKSALMKKLMGSAFFRQNVPSVLAATLATFPIVSFYFYEFPVIAFISNLIIVPTVALTVSAGFVTSIFGLVNIGIAGLTAFIPRLLIQFYNYMCEWFASLPFGMIFTGRPGFLSVAAFYCAFAAIVWAMRRDKWSVKLITRKRVFLATIAGYGLTAVAAAAIPAPLTIAMLDVGQGDCVMVSYGGQAFIIDGGGRDISRIGDDQGVWTLIPYMNYMGIERLDAAFVSHAHADHAIGVIEVIETGKLDKLFLFHNDRSDIDVLEHMLNSAESMGTEVIYIGAGDQFAFFGEVIISCLYPTAGTVFTGNDASLVLMLDAGGTRFLFTGDMEQAAEREMLFLYDTPGVLFADVLKLAHHGSRTSSSQEFLEAVSPVVSIAGMGYNNLYGHPHPDVAGRLADMGIPLFRTDLMGAIRVFPGEEVIKLQTMAGKADERIKRAVKIW